MYVYIYFKTLYVYTIKSTHFRSCHCTDLFTMIIQIHLYIGNCVHILVYSIISCLRLLYND